MDDEVIGTGNSYNYDARFYNSRLGKFLSCDPATQKYPFLSPYASFGGNPIYFKDNGGKTLEPGGNVTKALEDIRSLVPKEYQTQIQINSAGKIEFKNYEQLPDAIKSYEGVKLVNDLIRSPNDYKYNVDKRFVAKQRSTGLLFSGKLTPNENGNDPRLAIVNHSITPRSDATDRGLLPTDGYEGEVTIMDGEFKRDNPNTGTGEFTYERAKVVFHELKENFFRTEEKKDYPGNDGAHQEAANLGNKFSIEITGQEDLMAGYVTKFIEY